MSTEPASKVGRTGLSPPRGIRASLDRAIVAIGSIFQQRYQPESKASQSIAWPCAGPNCTIPRQSPRGPTENFGSFRGWLLCLAALTAHLAAPAQQLAPATPYVYGAPSRDGIGKFYHGREIAHFMTHQAAPWLERPERDQEERPDLVLKVLALKPGQTAADLGCGTGYFTWRMAQAVGPEGRVYGVEIQKEMLKHLEVNMMGRGITNVTGVLGTVEDPKLPAPVDLVLLVDVYHECSHPAEMMAAVCRSLKPGGRVVFVEYRGEDPKVPIKPLHKMTEAQLLKEMAAQPLEHVETVRTLPRQHLVIFRKKPAP